MPSAKLTPARIERRSFIDGANLPPGLDSFVITRDLETTLRHPGDFVMAPRFQFGASLTWQPLDGLTLLAAFDVNTLTRFVFVDSVTFITTPIVRGQVLAQFRF